VCISESSISKNIREERLCKVLDLDVADLSHHSAGNLDVEYNGSHLAYAVMTSGSTGTPKGVLVTQDNLMSNIDFLYGLYPTSRSSRLLQACSQAFDVSVFEIFFTWYAGMCLCAATKDELFIDLEHSVNRLGITHLSLTPTVASLVNPEHVPKVTFLVTAGEALTEHVRRQWVGRGLYQGQFGR
jgi:non-ribosomal peptide synthetase component F